MGYENIIRRLAAENATMRERMLIKFIIAFDYAVVSIKGYVSVPFHTALIHFYSSIDEPNRLEMFAPKDKSDS